MQRMIGKNGSRDQKDSVVAFFLYCDTSLVWSGLKEEGSGRGEAKHSEHSGLDPFHDVFNSHHSKKMDGMTEDKNKVNYHLWHLTN